MVDAEQLYESAREHWTEGRIASAESAYREAIEADAGFPYPYYELGLLLAARSRKHHDEAGSLLETFIKRFSTDPFFAEETENARLELERLAEAVSRAEELESTRDEIDRLEAQRTDAHDRLREAVTAAQETAEEAWTAAREHVAAEERRRRTWRRIERRMRRMRRKVEGSVGRKHEVYFHRYQVALSRYSRDPAEKAAAEAVAAMNRSSHVADQDGAVRSALAALDAFVRGEGAALERRITAAKQRVTELTKSLDG